jgi:hypothetical protein
VATPRPGTGGGSNGGGGNLTVGIGSSGGGSGSRPGGADVSVHGIDGAVMSALEQLPGGILFFTGPALVLTLPGLLVILAVGAQALGALAWLPIARRKLGGFGLVRSAEERRGR